MVEKSKLRYDVAFTGLDNRGGQNNCFVNVVIQSLWHLASFRQNFLEASKHHKHSDRELILRRQKSQLQEEKRQSQSSVDL